MSFTSSDFKKTIRGRGEGRRLYPYQIRDDRYRAAIGFMLAYYERMVGRRRAEFEQAALLEFFGDLRLARGLVACLGSSYLWMSPHLSDALDAPAANALAQAGVRRPADLRARLYQLANQRYSGFVPPDRRYAVLQELIAELAAPSDLQPEQVERLLHLDAEEEQILVRRSPPPDPDDLIDRYNYHSLETALCYSEYINLNLHGTIWTILRSVHNLARRYRIGYQVGALPHSLFDNRLELRLIGRRDALGGWGRAGRRLARAALRLLAAHPGSAIDGEALVHLDGKAAHVQLDQRALAILGAGVSAESSDATWEDSAIDGLQQAWSRLQSRGRTAGWGMRRDPEPLVGNAALVVPDFVLRRGTLSVALCVVAGRAAAGALRTSLTRLGPSLPMIVLAPAAAVPLLRGSPAVVLGYEHEPADAVAKIGSALTRIATPESSRRSA